MLTISGKEEVIKRGMSSRPPKKRGKVLKCLSSFLCISVSGDVQLGFSTVGKGCRGLTFVTVLNVTLLNLVPIKPIGRR